MLRLTCGMCENRKEYYLFNRFLERLLPKPLDDMLQKAVRNRELATFEAQAVTDEACGGGCTPSGQSRWQMVKLECHGEELSLKAFKNFTRDYWLKREQVENWNEQEERERFLPCGPRRWREKWSKG